MDFLSNLNHRLPVRFRPIWKFLQVGLIGFVIYLNGSDSIKNEEISDFRAISSQKLNSPPLILPPPCPDLFQAACKLKGISTDPTGWVISDAEGEKRASDLLSEIVSRSNSEMSKSEDIDNELIRLIYTPERVAKVKSAFDWAKNQIEIWIKNEPPQVFSPREKHELLTRIHRLQLELPQESKDYWDEPDLLTASGVFYERTYEGKTRIRVGGAYLLSVTSWFNLVFTFAHEIAHAIDPCEIGSNGWKIPAYTHLSSCFVKTGLVAQHRDRKECVRNDHLSEAFADWVGVKISATAMKKYATEFDRHQMISGMINSIRDLCEDDEDQLDPSDRPSHPQPEVRIRMLTNSPEIMALRCPQTPLTHLTPVCDFNVQK